MYSFQSDRRKRERERDREKQSSLVRIVDADGARCGVMAAEIYSPILTSNQAWNFRVVVPNVGRTENFHVRNNAGCGIYCFHSNVVTDRFEIRGISKQRGAADGRVDVRRRISVRKRFGAILSPRRCTRKYRHFERAISGW